MGPRDPRTKRTARGPWSEGEGTGPFLPGFGPLVCAWETGCPCRRQQSVMLWRPLSPLVLGWRTRVSGPGFP